MGGFFLLDKVVKLVGGGSVINDGKHAFSVTYSKGHPLSVDLRYGEEDSISPSTLFFAATKG